MRQLQSRLFAALGLIALFAASPSGAQTAAPAQPAAAAVPANAVKLGVIGPFSGPS